MGRAFAIPTFFVKKTLLEIAQNAKQTFVKMFVFIGEGGRENGIFATFPYGGEGGGVWSVGIKSQYFRKY